MMGWPWQFVSLDSEAKHTRHEILSQFALYSQLSVLIPIIGYQAYRLGAWLLMKRERRGVAYMALEEPSGDTRPADKSIGGIARRWRVWKWWLNDEVRPSWGSRGRWIAAVIWSLWLLFLCIFRTGNDYFHLTKRFGSVAAAQVPFHYLLAMRTRFSPMITLFRTSHEQLILWHRTSGNIIMVFLLIHGALYLNYYIISGTLIEHLQGLHASTGVVAVSLGAALAGTSLDAIRKWSYRVFFFCHLAIGLGVMPILFFHAKPLRVYTIEALTLFILDRILRRLDTVTEPVSITQIPHTDLMKIQVPITSKKLGRFEFNPGQHVYVAMPSDKSSKISKRLLSNPFTVAKVSSTGITLVLRALQGPTTQSLWLHARRFHSKPLLSIEGPYGCPINIPDLITNFDRILLVAGGIGATFTWPLYGALREQLEAESRDPDQLNFIWAVRSSAEAGWISDSEEQAFSEDPNIQIYLTRHHDLAESLDHDLSDEGIEMDDMHTNPGLIGGIKPRIGRPFLKDIVEQIFSINSGERVAVLFCGPQGLGRELRTHVGGWAAQGRDVMWHEESFGM